MPVNSGPVDTYSAALEGLPMFLAVFDVEGRAILNV